MVFTRLRRASWITIACVVASTLAPALAHATFPGTNGPIAVVVDAPTDTAGLKPSQFPKIQIVQPGTVTGPAPFRGFAPAWSTDGRIAYECDGICVANANGTGAHRVPGLAKTDGYPAWSPDGTKLLFTRSWAHNQSVRIGVADLTTGAVRMLTTPPVKATLQAMDLDPAWGPDGTAILFDRYTQRFTAAGAGTGQKTEIMAIPAAGGDVVPLVTAAWNHSASSGDWSPDGSSIVFLRDGKQGALRPLIKTIDTGAERALASPRAFGVLNPTWAPDGTAIAYEAFSTTNYQGPKLCIVTLAPAKVACPKSRHTQSSPAWQPLR